MRYFRVLILSLTIHLLIGILLSRFAPPAPPPLSDNLAFVEWLEKPELARRPVQRPRDEKQFVRSVQPPKEVLTDERRNSRFSSEDEQFVLEETRARMNGMSANRSSRGGESDRLGVPGVDSTMNREDSQRRLQSRKNRMDLKPVSALERVKKEILSGDFDTGASEVQDMQKQAGGEKGRPFMRSFGGVEAGVSTFGEAAPSDVRFGDFTALNTDRNLFYSFYARMEEKIRHRWVDYARAAIYNLPSDPRRQTGKDAWVTKLEVVLDREGRFVRAILHESSGIGSLDSAPVQAFKEAHQFPNPPLDLVKSDGTIRIYYAFNVYQ